MGGPRPQPWERPWRYREARGESRWADGGLVGLGVPQAAGAWRAWAALRPAQEGAAKPRGRRREPRGAYAMQVSQGATLLALALCAVFSLVLGTEGKRKLQIGVKKRVDNCPIKSRKGDVLHMHYTGKLEDGTEFDSSLTRDQPFIFSLGTGQVIKGWDQGLLGMCEGEKRKLVIPSELGYGDRGAPPKIPGGATLIFEVELLKIERRQEL
ncbi:peptidyl-prolyl cis-trans isomerase FKBP2 isoform X3 [Zootoca vivipara]|uniref:peptidyl-prolyl cis-trans isomerase FKBP2 isoform X3 n=1 Tax=Zootoca vivipara TaxID=8524 RepID=UPI00293BE7AF|nr:peptidyl-prolyl cis-trans isomerase FKBP2 isoform X3 [Zootoca vivipara]